MDDRRDDQNIRRVDTHFHLWDWERPWYLTPEWLARRSEPDTGTARRPRRYLLRDYLGDARAWNVSKAIHVAATVPTLGYSPESKWIAGLATDTDFPDGFIAHVNYRQPTTRVRSALERNNRSDRFRGVRVLNGLDYGDRAAIRLMMLLSERKLIYDAVEHPPAHRALAAAAVESPELSVVLEHCGWPSGTDSASVSEWRTSMAVLAKVPNVSCKISGLPMVLHRVDAQALRPWILRCIDYFGTDRCVIGSNFPVDRMFGSFDQLMDAYDTALADLSTTEKTQIYSANAERIYRI